jgi:hypothetical protein
LCIVSRGLVANANRNTTIELAGFESGFDKTQHQLNNKRCAGALLSFTQRQAASSQSRRYTAKKRLTSGRGRVEAPARRFRCKRRLVAWLSRTPPKDNSGPSERRSRALPREASLFQDRIERHALRATVELCLMIAAAE